jgi:hypothetical protein
MVAHDAHLVQGRLAIEQHHIAINEVALNRVADSQVSGNLTTH